MIRQWQQNSQGDWCLPDGEGSYVIHPNDDYGWDLWYYTYDRTGGHVSEVFLATANELLNAKFFAEQDYRAAQAQERILQ